MKRKQLNKEKIAAVLCDMNETLYNDADSRRLKKLVSNIKNG